MILLSTHLLTSDGETRLVPVPNIQEKHSQEPICGESKMMLKNRPDGQPDQQKRNNLNFSRLLGHRHFNTQGAQPQNLSTFSTELRTQRKTTFVIKGLFTCRDDLQPKYEDKLEYFLDILRYFLELHITTPNKLILSFWKK